jgi:dihydrofolate reductase
MNIMSKIIMIASIQKSNRGIGYNGNLLFPIPQDLKFFKETTTGHVVIMGRKTFESIAKKTKKGNEILPKREKIVITRSHDQLPELLTTFPSLKEGIVYAQEKFPDKYIFLIGGQKIYEEGLKYASQILLTEVEAGSQKEKEADAFFPKISLDDWIFEEQIQKDTHTDDEGGSEWNFVTNKYRCPTNRENWDGL